MKTKNKIILSLSTLGALATPIIAVVSCGKETVAKVANPTKASENTRSGKKETNGADTAVTQTTHSSEVYSDGFQGTYAEHFAPAPDPVAEPTATPKPYEQATPVASPTQYEQAIPNTIADIQKNSAIIRILKTKIEYLDSHFKHLLDKSDARQFNHLIDMSKKLFKKLVANEKGAYASAERFAVLVGKTYTEFHYKYMQRQP